MEASLPPELGLVARGWMHGNAIVVCGGRPALIDTGYHVDVSPICRTFAELTGRSVAEALATIALTHTHSDHAGGVAELVGQSGAEVRAHADVHRMVETWDTRAMWLDSTGQQLPRYRVDTLLEHGARTRLGSADWTVLHTPGHATGGLSFLWEQQGILVTGDALWEDGFGILNPWSDGPRVFEEASLALDRIAETDARVIVPGHGRAFVGLPAAIQRARSRLEYFERRPDRLQVQIVRSCLGFLRLARPELSSAAVREVTRRMARSLQLSEEDAARAIAELLPGEVFAEPDPDPIHASSEAGD